MSNGNVVKSFVVLMLHFVLHLHHNRSMENYNIMKKFDLFWIVEGVQIYAKDIMVGKKIANL